MGEANLICFDLGFVIRDISKGLLYAAVAEHTVNAITHYRTSNEAGSDSIAG